MGTSGAYGGPGGGTPLIPSWLASDVDVGLGFAVPVLDATARPAASGTTAVATQRLPEVPSPGRFTNSRANFSRFAASGGRDRASLGRAVSGYVSTASGGARTAARRMGSSRVVGARLLGFLADARARGAHQALRALNLDALAGRPIEEIFLGMADYVCPEGGTVDEGIARDAFIETIVDLAAAGITDIDALTIDQMQTVLELFATHAIEARLCNDIGMKVVTVPTTLRDAARVQAQLRDFIRRGVADALTSARAALQALTPETVLGFVGGVYEAAFGILQVLGEREAQA
jgi:hypothetical protein